MRIASLSLEGFRNIEFASIEFKGNRTFVFGPNAQGKSNLLEALGLLTALRSFRGQESREMIGSEKSEARLVYAVEHEGEGETTIEITLRRGSKRVTVDGEGLGSVGEVLGRFPVVPLSSQDLQLVRGAPQLRRRFLDYTLSAMDAEYLGLLRQYQKAIQERNAALKNGADRALLRPFESLLGRSAIRLIERRREGAAFLRKRVRQCYEKISREDEEPDVRYVPDFEGEDTEGYLEWLRSHAERDRVLQSTTRGPHRDDLQLNLQSNRARGYASEGQQRSLVIALRFAQAAWFRERSSVQPVLLADDILGELDDARKEGFWSLLQPDMQLFATGTRKPEPSGGILWQVFGVRAGVFKAE